MDKMSIKKLKMGFGSGIILTIIISIVALIGLSLISSNFKELTGKTYVADEGIKMGRIEINTAARKLREKILNTEKNEQQKYIDKINEHLKNVKEDVQLLSAVYDTEEGLINEYSNVITEWIAIAEKIIEVDESGNREKAVQILLNECSPMIDELVNLGVKLDTMTTDTKLMYEESNSSRILFVTIIILVLVII